MLNLISGILGSLIATIIWVSFSILYDFYSKRKINLYIELAQDSARLFQHSINFDDYNTALMQAEKLIEYYKSIDENIKFLTYLPKKKKLIRTYLYNSLYIVSLFKNLTIGHSGKQELEARCNKCRIEYLYYIKFDEHHEEPFLSFSLELLQEINSHFFIKNGLINNYLFQLSSKNQKRNILKQIVSVHAFNYKNSINHFMRKSIFTKNEYYKFIDKLTK